MIIFFACSATIIGLSIAGIRYSAPLSGNYKKLKCSLYLFLGEILNGPSKTHAPSDITWEGINPIVNKADKILINFDPDVFENLKALPLDGGKFSNSKGKVDTMKSTFAPSAKKVSSPNDGTSIELTLLNNIDDEQAGLLSPLYIEIIGFQTTVIDKLRSISDIANDIDTSTITTAQNALNDVKDITKDIESYKTDIYDYTDMGDAPIDIAEIVMICYYSINLVCIILIVLGMVLRYMFNCGLFSCISNLGCAIIMTFMIIGFLLSAILFPLSAVIIEGCELISLETLKDDHSFIPSDVWDQIDLCLVDKGDGTYGDLYTKHNLASKINFANSGSSAFNATGNYTDNDGNLVLPGSDLFKKELKKIHDEDPGKASLEFVANSLSNRFSGNCKQDKVVWAKTDCNGVTEFTIGNTANNLCVPIIEFLSNKVDLVNRYGACSSYGTKIGYIIDYATEVRQIINDLLEEIGSTGSLNTYTDKMHTDCRTSGIKGGFDKINTIMDDFKDLQKDLDTLSGGLKEGLDCRFLSTSFNRIYDSVCGDFTTNLTFMAVLVGVISAMSFVTIIAFICVYRRKGGETTTSKK